MHKVSHTKPLHDATAQMTDEAVTHRPQTTTIAMDAKPTKHTQTLTLQIFLQFIITAYKLQTLNFPLYKRFVGFTKCNKSPSHLPFNERPKALRPCKAFGRSTSGIHARPRKRVRFCCSVKPSQLWWGLFLIRIINEIFRTIPRLALNLPPLSKVRCCRPKKFGRLPEGLSH